MAITAGAQTERRGVSRPGRDLLGGDLPAAFPRAPPTRRYLKVLPPPSVYGPTMLSGVLPLKVLLLTVSAAAVPAL